MPNRFLFTGQQYDPVTQQYYLRTRFYNPVIARFTQEDTYRGDGLNLYAYCRNNPVCYVDPSGHWCGNKEQIYQGLLEREGLTAEQAAQNPDLQMRLMAEAANITKGRDIGLGETIILRDISESDRASHVPSSNTQVVPHPEVKSPNQVKVSEVTDYWGDKMKISVNKISNESIYFSTDYGEGKGIWKGVNKPVEKEYFVEFDIDKSYNYVELIISKNQDYQLIMCEEKICLTLKLLEYDELGCATFRFGDSIIEIETNYDERFLALKNLFVTIIVETLNVYDENI